MAHVAPHPHELEGHLIYSRHGVKPYWALRSIFSDLPTDRDQGWTWETEIDGELWTVTLRVQESGIAPRDSDSVDKLYEYRVNCEGEGRRKIKYLIQPRWSDSRTEGSEMMTTGDSNNISVPRDLGEAVNVRVDGASNCWPEEVRSLLPEFLETVWDDLDVNWDRRYFRGPLHKYSNITTFELYVRIRNSMITKLIEGNGPLARIQDLLAEKKGAHAFIEINNKEIVGYRHRYELNPSSTSALFPDAPRQLGKQLKVYHPKYVRNQDGQRRSDEDPLAHPKFGVLFRQGLNNGESVKWSDRERIYHELEQTIVNVLDWGDAPIQPDATTYVADDHFAVRESDRDVGRFSDPTPEIEVDQRKAFAAALADGSDNLLDMVEMVATDGGQPHYTEVAEKLGIAISTVYDNMARVPGLLESDNGAIRLRSEKLKQEVLDVVHATGKLVKQQASSMAYLLGVDEQRWKQKGAAWEAWLEKYDVELLQADLDEGMRLRIDAILDRVNSTIIPKLDMVLLEGYKAWKDSGAPRDLFEEAHVMYEDRVDGAVTVKPKTVV